MDDKMLSEINLALHKVEESNFSKVGSVSIVWNEDGLVMTASNPETFSSVRLPVEDPEMIAMAKSFKFKAEEALIKHAAGQKDKLRNLLLQAAGSV